MHAEDMLPPEMFLPQICFWFSYKKFGVTFWWVPIKDYGFLEGLYCIGIPLCMEANPYREPSSLQIKSLRETTMTQNPGAAQLGVYSGADLVLQGFWAQDEAAGPKV